LRLDWLHPDAVRLREAMQAEVRGLYRGDHEDRDGGLTIDPASVLLTEVLYDGVEPVGHVAVRRLGEHLEIKRMYVLPEHRGAGVADRLLAAVEDWARERGAPRLVLHTGEKQVAAIAFYTRHGYTPIPVYPPYEQLAYSRCFEKVLGQS
jgi:GNAT superfamily N-acetyltransferase